jgi:hypothetical protein
MLQQYNNFLLRKKEHGIGYVFLTASGVLIKKKFLKCVVQLCITHYRLGIQTWKKVIFLVDGKKNFLNELTELLVYVSGVN